MLYNWFDNKVMGQDQAAEKYKSKGITASVEAGYSFRLGESAHQSYWLQPKAQVVWMGVQADDNREANGTLVKDDTAGNLLTRMGVKPILTATMLLITINLESSSHSWKRTGSIIRSLPA